MPMCRATPSWKAPGQATTGSEDEGSTWEPLATGLDAVRVSSIAVSPGFAADGTILVVGNNHLYRTTDAAKTWEPLSEGLLPGDRVHDVAVSPAFATDHTTFAASDLGRYRSQDGGLTWQLYASGLPGSAHSVSLSLIVRP